MLSGKNIIGFIPSKDRTKARTFYEGVLGLEFKEDDGFAVVMNANGTEIRIANVGDYTPFRFTILGWAVEDIDETVASMQAKGVEFESYDFIKPEHGVIWTAPDGARVAWFKDVDGNVLSVSQDTD